MGVGALVKNPGFGLGLRSVHYEDFLVDHTQCDWLEIISDNYLIEGGKPLDYLTRIRANYPMVMHGVAMSLASYKGPDVAYLERLRRLADRIEPLWVSDHLCWVGNGQSYLHDLNPIPYTEEAAVTVVSAIQRAQDVLGRRLVLENVSSYVNFTHNAVAEWEFLSYVANEADCHVLLDVNNIYVSSVNHGFNPLDYLRAMPASRVQQIHLAGHSRKSDHIVDTHDAPVAQEVWDLYREACALLGPRATMIERDDNIPALADIVDELNTARTICAQSAQTASPAQPPQAFQSFHGWARAEPGSSPTLRQLQTDWSNVILRAECSTPGEPSLNLRAGHRFGVYHHAYAARLTEVLADVFEKTRLYVGSDLFEQLTTRFAREQPPSARSLSRYGETFPQYLQSHYSENPELFELARMEWRMSQCFFAQDELPRTAAGLADPLWLSRSKPLLAHLKIDAISRNVPTIWNAIHRDEDVPEVSALDTPTDLVVWRNAFQPHFCTATGVESQLLRCMLEGASVASACERYSEGVSGLDNSAMATLFRKWAELGLLV